MRALSLFSGVGGFELGMQRAGIETVMQVEQDKHCLAVLERHWPDVERVTDVRDVGMERVADHAQGKPIAAERSISNAEPSGADVDLVYGGFPCQDLSVAGKRTGFGGERSSLWYEFHRVLSEVRPRWALIENVPGLLSSNSGHDFAILLSGLDELGYDASWAILDAQHFGVPQRRRRVFVVAGPRGRGAEQVLSVCESCDGDTQTSGATGTGITDGAGPGVARALGNVGGGADYGANKGTLAIARVAWALQERDSKRPDSSTKDGHLLPEKDEVRRPTPIECERLMGWPDDHTRYAADGTEIADGNRYKMAGNGVVAPVAEWIGHRLVAVDKLLGATT